MAHNGSTARGVVEHMGTFRLCMMLPGVRSARQHHGETTCVGKGDDPSQIAFLALLGDSDVSSSTALG